MSKINEFSSIHFIGVGGISMSSLAKLMLLKGKTVTGSDIKYSEEVCTLNQWGVKIWIGHDPEKLKDVSLVVYTAAIPENDPELVYARQNGIPTVARQHFLNEVSKDYDYVIAVSGTHGKTTVTGMITYIFKESGVPFTSHIGGNISTIGNLVYSGHKCFITEACEYKKSLLSLSPDIAIILNVEVDHPDTYSNIDELYQTFNQFISNTKKDGLAVINAESDFFNQIITDKKTLGYGFEGNISCKISEVEEYKNGYYRFKIDTDNTVVTINLNIPGYHNIFNAAASYTACLAYGLDKYDIQRGIQNFTGIERRFEYKGSAKNARVYIDYAHHPSEIKASINTALSLKPNRIFTVFQPHTYSRTKRLFDEFVDCLESCQYLYINKEYAARETPDMGISAYQLYKHMKNNDKKNLYYYDSTLSLAKQLLQQLKDDDLILILGAGDIDSLASLIVDRKI